MDHPSMCHAARLDALLLRAGIDPLVRGGEWAAERLHLLKYLMPSARHAALLSHPGDVLLERASSPDLVGNCRATWPLVVRVPGRCCSAPTR